MLLGAIARVLNHVDQRLRVSVDNRRMARRHPPGIPPVQCHAMSKRTGERCRAYAVVGTSVCRWHGVNSTVRRAAQREVTLAQLMEGDRRHPWEVVLDMTHTLDSITQDFRREVVAGKKVTIDQLDRLIELAQTTHHLATTAITSKAAEKMAVAFERHTEGLGELVGIAVDAATDRLGLTDPWRAYALQVAAHALRAANGGDPGDDPQPPDASEHPLISERDVRARTRRDSEVVSNRPAIEAAPCVPSVDDLATLDDAGLRSLAQAVLDEADRRKLDG
jgi:hypothetical protein